MIINQNNKDAILKGQMKRGFNQTPEELKEKLLNQSSPLKKKPNEESKMADYLKFKKIRNELKRF